MVDIILIKRPLKAVKQLLEIRCLRIVKILLEIALEFVGKLIQYSFPLNKLCTNIFYQ